jgi:predicted transposase/invertase (TIGR01784 family)
LTIHNVEQHNLEKGALNTKIAIAQSMKNKGFDGKRIAEITDLTTEKVQAI